MTGPTQDAYDAACHALHHYRAIADEATAALFLEASSMRGATSPEAKAARSLRRRFEAGPPPRPQVNLGAHHPLPAAKAPRPGDVGPYQM